MPRPPTIAACLLLLIFLFVVAQAPRKAVRLETSPNLSVIDAGRWKSVHKGIDFRSIALERSEPNQLIDLKLLRFDMQQIDARVLRSAQFQLKAATAKTFVDKSGALAAINANYFDAEGKPLAFLKTAGQTINARISPSPLYTGVFGIAERRPFIAHRDEFSAERVEEGLQSGPLLLFRGSKQPVTGVPNRASRRALIGIDQQQRLMIAVTDNFVGGLFWSELQEIFSAPLWQIQLPDLLNLDGGGSAQFYIKAGNFESLVAGTAEVPVAIAFFPKAISQ